MVLTTLDFALGYAKLGWRCLPLWPKEKRPLYANWPADASCDERMVRQYFGGDPTRNIGITTGEQFDAWDVEVEHVPALTAWMDDKGYVLPEAPIARTGRGGIHILTQPINEGHTRKLVLNGVHIGELKSTGGFIVVAPSKTDAAYAWFWAPPRMTLPPAPDFLKSLVHRPETTKKVVMWQKASLAPESDLAPLVEAVRGAQEHNRNDLLHWAAHRAADDGIPQRLAEPKLMEAFIEISRPYEDRFEREHEARATIHSAYAR